MPEIRQIGECRIAGQQEGITGFGKVAVVAPPVALDLPVNNLVREVKEEGTVRQVVVPAVATDPAAAAFQQRDLVEAQPEGTDLQVYRLHITGEVAHVEVI
jgi:hypothetical protein